MDFVYAITTKLLAAVVLAALLLSCTSTKTEESTVKRKLISAKAYKHATKISTKQDIQWCRKTVPKDKIDDCMSKKGWVISSKQYD